MTAHYAGHYEGPPRDDNGRPIPNATFQLYEIGTKTSPTYYADRLKSSTVAGDPKSDALGNVSVWPEPGIYEYWYGGEFIQLVTVGEDDDELTFQLAAAVATIQEQLATMPTTAEMNVAIAAAGGPGIGAELTANKDQPGGYPSLTDPDGVVPDNELPASATTGTRDPSPHGPTHGYSGSDPIPDIDQYFGGVVTRVSTDSTAGYGALVIADSSGGDLTITLPNADNGIQTPIAVKREGAGLVTVTGNLEPPEDIPLLIDGMCVRVFEDNTAETWIPVNSYIPLTSLARLDADNDFGGNVISNARDKIVVVSGTSHTIDKATEFGCEIRCTNGSATSVTFPNNASIGDWAIVRQDGAGQVSIVAASGASLSEPDGHSKTAKQVAALLVTCVANSGGTSAAYDIGGYTGT